MNKLLNWNSENREIVDRNSSSIFKSIAENFNYQQKKVFGTNYKF